MAKVVCIVQFIGKDIVHFRHDYYLYLHVEVDVELQGPEELQKINELDAFPEMETSPFKGG